MCIIHSVCVCSHFLDTKQNNEFILPILVRGLKDKISNVKFYTVKLTKAIYGNLDMGGKEKITSAIKLLGNDDDADVKYYAGKFLENVK